MRATERVLRAGYKWDHGFASAIRNFSFVAGGICCRFYSVHSGSWVEHVCTCQMGAVLSVLWSLVFFFSCVGADWVSCVESDFVSGRGRTHCSVPCHTFGENSQECCILRVRSNFLCIFADFGEGSLCTTHFCFSVNTGDCSVFCESISGVSDLFGYTVCSAW